MMEALLSLSFDNLSSYEPPKIRKGLRQVESLLAQICLSQKRPPADRRRSMLSPSKQSSSSSLSSDPSPPPDPKAAPALGPKQLDRLPEDPAYREFFKLQEGFEWNVALRLVGTLDRLLGKSNDGQNDLLILGTLDLIQGILLLHPPSRHLFGREVYMNHLLDLLEPINAPAIQSATLLTLVVALLDCPSNTRVFETLDGLLTVTSLFKSRTTAREVKLKLVEFLYFYLLPETGNSSPRMGGGGGGGSGGGGIERPQSRDSLMVPPRPMSSGGALERPGMGRRGSTAMAKSGSGAGKNGEGEAKTRSTEQKQALLQRYLSSVEDLVKDLRESSPFGGV